MLIAGLQKLTLVDYPGKIAALIFTQGCNFACGYCHNAEMIPALRVLPDRPELEIDNILHFLEHRQGLLDGVVISGGEPTLHEDLLSFIQTIRAMGFLIKLDTNGSNPKVLKELLDQDLLDYVAMDLKQCAEKYADLVKNDCRDEIQASIRLLMNSGVEHEFRSTIMPSQHDLDDIHQMGRMIHGAQHWYLQNFRPGKTLSRAFLDQRSFTDEEMHEMASVAQQYVNMVGLRNLASTRS